MTLSKIRGLIFSFEIILLFICNQASANADKFLGVSNMLSNSHVNSIYQDKKGFIWACTENGLNVFDGSGFKVYNHQSNDTTSLINNSVLTVLEDKEGRFWVGTVGGVQLFDRKTEKFSNFHFSYPNVTDFTYISCIIEDSKGNIWMSTSRSGVICIKAKDGKPIYYMRTNSNICSNKINTICEDRFGNIWIGSQDNGISVLNVDNHMLVNYAHQSNDPNSISSDKIFSILETKDGNILVGSIDGGIDLFDYSTRIFSRNYIPGNMIFTMKADSRNNLWIGTDGEGLKCYNFTDKTISTYETELPSLDMRRAKVHGILEDQQGNIWVALYQKGILMISSQKKSFNNISFNPFYQNKSIGTECVLSILEDGKRDLWIGTDGDGIYRLNAAKEMVRHYTLKKDNAHINPVVLSIFEDSSGRIWIGTYLTGLFVYNKATDDFEKREIIVNGHSVKHINTISEDEDGNLWIGTNEDGVCIYSPGSRNVRYFLYDLMKTKNQILSNSIHTITFGKDGCAWIGTSGAGLSCYNRKTNSFVDYSFNNKRLNNNNIYSVKQDMQGNIWVGTAQGLSVIDAKTDQISCYTEKDGLPSASINGLEVDKDGNLWISTCSGLSLFDVSKKTFTNYSISDGLINNEFRRGAHFCSPFGELFFGGISGVTYFYPFKSTVHPLLNLAFTDLFIYNKKVKADESDVLSGAINYSESIRLEYDVKSFSIGFSAIEYNTPGDVIYQVKMEGFDNEWSVLPLGSRLATYTNLAPGKYTFKVKANLQGMTPLERSLSVVIVPPLWLTWWAKLFYVCVAVIILYFAYWTALTKIRKKKEDMQKMNESQIMQSKLQFFTDISHEIRTPLTLILTPLEQLLKNAQEGGLRDTYKLIYQNGQRILHLVNQVMDMRKLDKGQMKLTTTLTDVGTFFRETASSFAYVAKERQIDFPLEMKEDLPQVWIDREKMEKVLFNVLSNAFKYTPDGGRIAITVAIAGTDLQVCIADSGSGIPLDRREAIFDRFYQIPDASNRNKMGTGIGLHLSRSLMNVHHGQIFVDESQEDEGATFVIRLPLGDSHLEISEKRENVSVAPANQSSSANNAYTEEHLTFAPSARSKFKYKVLVVEDDRDIREYIATVLGSDYRILLAEDGRKGLEITIQELPDCIVTDVMMPVMDGMEMCDKIKKNEKTSHIPVVMLTAKATIEQRIEGLQMGADSYIPKPFNVDHLKTRINKLIELRRVIKDKFEDKDGTKQDKPDGNIKSFDEKFLEKLEAIVKKQLADSDLSVETISEEIGVSRSQLQRKLKQLTNQNPSEYIKITRLKYAAQLLVTKKLTISEVTYAAGFSSLSHFSNSFKDYYGMSPTRYIEINTAQVDEN